MKNTALDLLILTIFVKNRTSYELKQQLEAIMVLFSKTLIKIMAYWLMDSCCDYHEGVPDS